MATMMAQKAFHALSRIQRLLAYGIKACPTDGEYHAKSYSQAHDIAKETLDAMDGKDQEEKQSEHPAIEALRKVSRRIQYGPDETVFSEGVRQYRDFRDGIKSIVDGALDATKQPRPVTDADFNKFRHKNTGEVVEGWQWWPGRARSLFNCPVDAPLAAGDWGVTDSVGCQRFFAHSEFVRYFDPIHPERKRWQWLCDCINEYPARAGGTPYRLMRHLICVRDVYYVKDREPVAESGPAQEPTICVKCKHLDRGTHDNIPSCWECRAVQRQGPLTGKVRNLECSEINTDRNCDHYQAKPDE